MGVWYATREDVINALDVKATARDDAQIDAAIEAASRSVERRLHRLFAPMLDTRVFPWPAQSSPSSWRVWLDDDELIDATTVVSGGVVLTSDQYFLEPANNPSKGKPYQSIEINLGSSGSFQSAATWQRSLAITGLFGYSDDSIFAGTTVGTFTSANNQATFVAANVGVGSVLEINGERCVTTDRGLADTGRVLSADLAASNAATLVQTDGATIYPGEILTIDAEQMWVDSIAGNNVVVKRAWNGSVLATHSTSAKVYSARLFNLLRGQLGTTPAEHDAGSTWNVWQPPGPVRALAIGEALTTFGSQMAGYAGDGGGSDGSSRKPTSIDDLRESTWQSHGRKNRQRTV